MQTEEILLTIVQLHREILRENLAGIYIHGSIALGCFNPNQSDIDFLTVTGRPPTLAQKKELLLRLASLEARAPEKGFEMSVVLAEYCRRFVYPTPYEAHYSKMHRESFLADPEKYCQTMRGTDPDLAAHFTVVQTAGITLFGEDARTLFSPVPRKAYLDSIRKDVENAEKDIENDPVYFILNLCRVLAYIRSGLVLSKAGGGHWGMEKLPKKFEPVIREAVKCYESGASFSQKSENARDFARYMLPQIFAK